MFCMNLNERISKIIEYSELSSSEFADAVDVQRSSVSHITSGRNKPSLDFLIKVKEQFPELEWDWLIKGDGEMLKKPEEAHTPEAVPEKTKPTSLPDLFTLIDDDNFGFTEKEDRVMKTSFEEKTETPRESAKAAERHVQDILNDSPPLEKNTAQKNPQAFETQGNKIKRIVLFYENGKFESFDP